MKSIGSLSIGVYHERINRCSYESKSTRASSFVKTKPLKIYSTIKKSLLFPQSSCHPLFLLLAFPYHVIIYPT